MLTHNLHQERPCHYDLDLALAVYDEAVVVDVAPIIRIGMFDKIVTASSATSPTILTY